MEVSVIEQDYGGQTCLCWCYPTCHRIAEGVTQAHQLSPVLPVDRHNLSRTTRLVGIVDAPGADSAIQQAIELYTVPPTERGRLLARRRD